jgi:hypothetical protein
VKKAAVAIPFAALLVLAVLLWRRTEAPVRPEKRALPTEEDRALPAEAQAGRTLPSAPNAPSAGSLRVLVSSGGTPVAGASVIVQRDGVDDHKRFSSPEQGGQVIQGMPPGSYVVGVRHPRFLPAEATAEVMPGKVTDVRMELVKGGRLFGKVTDPSGNALPRTMVALMHSESKVALGPALSATTDALGQYELPAVPRGRFGLRFRHERFKAAERSAFTFLQGTESYEVNVALEAGARVTGRVLDEQGTPIQGARVMIGNPGSGGVTQTDRNGEFGMHGLTDDPVNASVSAAGHGTVIRRGIRPNSDDLEFRLPRPGKIVGRLDGEEVPEQFVVILSRHEADLNTVLRVDTRYFTNPAGGLFVLEDVAPALYWVEVQAQGYESTDKVQVTVEAGKVTPELRMRFTKK